MAYEPREWSCGDKITTDALNHIEQGIANTGDGSDIMYVNYNDSTQTVDKTFNEIVQAVEDGREVIVTLEYGDVKSYLRLCDSESASVVFSLSSPDMRVDEYDVDYLYGMRFTAVRIQSDNTVHYVENIIVFNNN